MLTRRADRCSPIMGALTSSRYWRGATEIPGRVRRRRAAADVEASAYREKSGRRRGSRRELTPDTDAASTLRSQKSLSHAPNRDKAPATSELR